ncbi:MAG: fasciclin domain-containing protein [Syntrophotaleaceae bacterium]
MQDILTTLKKDGSFQTFLGALKKAGLEKKLEEPGPMTLFAPNDQACTRVNMNSIQGDPDKLNSVLTYHIARGIYHRDDLKKTEDVYTFFGKHLTVATELGELHIDNAKFITTDIECSNGVIHVIDNVFLPQFSGWYCACC